MLVKFYRRKILAIALFALLALSSRAQNARAAVTDTAAADTVDTDKAADQERIKRLEQKVDQMEMQMNNPPGGPKSFGAETNGTLPQDYNFSERALRGLTFGTYGEMKLRYQETPGGNRLGFDGSRVVLLAGYHLTDKIFFNAEFEWEHAGVESDEPGGGAVSVEQAYIDFKINEHFNWRSLGIDVVPIGFINLFHEPTLFYSTERPELYSDLIPATWTEGSSSLYGKIVDGLNYQFQVNLGLQDHAQNSGEAGTINGVEGIRNARPELGNFDQDNNDLGYAMRLSYNPWFIPGLAGSTSGYFTRTTPRKLPGTFVPGNTELAIFDTELRYRLPRTGLELRGEFVNIWLFSHGNLLSNNDGDPSNNTGNSMYGYNLEVAYHVDLKEFTPVTWDLVPFYRYTRIDLQHGGYQGSDFNAPTGQGDREIHTFGLSLFVDPRVVLKVDGSIPLDESVFGPQANKVETSIGWLF